jgi:hypothetical protein
MIAYLYKEDVKETRVTVTTAVVWFLLHWAISSREEYLD